MSYLRNLSFGMMMLGVVFVFGLAPVAAKESPVGQTISSYKPSGPSPTVKKEPPSPVNKNNPQNDPEVQAGYDDHQTWYKNKNS